MSELKEWTASKIEEYDDARLELAEDGKIDCTRVYIKQDVDKVIADKDKEIAKLKEECRWRPVSEELPEVEEDCGEIFLVAVAVETEKKTKGSYVTSAEFCNGEWYNDSTGNELEENIEREDCFYRSKVTYWMPMLKAPEEEK